jgi:hypothetical protein
MVNAIQTADPNSCAPVRDAAAHPNNNNPKVIVAYASGATELQNITR